MLTCVVQGHEANKMNVLREGTLTVSELADIKSTRRHLKPNVLASPRFRFHFFARESSFGKTVSRNESDKSGA